MKSVFTLAVLLLAVVIAISFWVAKRRAAERARFESVSQQYQAREEALLKSRSKEIEAVTRILPTPGASAATPAAGTPAK